MFRGRARRYRSSGVSAETLADTALPLIEMAANQIGLPASMSLSMELEAQGYFEAGLVAQWHLVHQAIWRRIENLPDAHATLLRWTQHPEAKIRFFAPGLWAIWGQEEPEAAIAGLLPLADDTDFRVLEAVQAFGVRPFAYERGPSILNELGAWFTHPSPRVRRSAISSVRPRGFWVKHLEWATENPAYLAPVLELYREEEDRFPANAVANCFNDISRKQPLFALGVLQRWMEQGGFQVEHMARKGLRSLLKSGDVQALALFGFAKVDVELVAHLVQGSCVPPNSNLHFDLVFQNPGDACEVELVYELETTGRNASRPRRKKYQGGRFLLPTGTMPLRIRERIFDRKAAPLLDGPAAAKFYLNGEKHAQVDFSIRR
ncbi:MAG: hypothetical protein QM477_01665 [Planctomycetota bacterium]